MAVAYLPTDDIGYVPMATHMAAIGALGNQHRRDAEAIEALQETARAFQLERTELQAQLQEAEANAAVALKMLSEARQLVRRSLPLLNAAPGFKDEIRAWLDGTATPAAPDDRQRLGDNVAYWLQVVLGGVQLDVGKRRHAERALREWMGGDESTSTS